MCVRVGGAGTVVAGCCGATDGDGLVVEVVGSEVAGPEDAGSSSKTQVFSLSKAVVEVPGPGPQTWVAESVATTSGVADGPVSASASAMKRESLLVTIL